MSVLIKGLIMPSCCDGCTFSDWSNLHQTASCKLHDYDPCFADHSREYTDKRAEFCPLVEIPEPHEGEWVYGEDSTADCVDGYRCSQCGFFIPWDYNHKLIDYINDYAYCPKCGARMKGAKHEAN